VGDRLCRGSGRLEGLDQLLAANEAKPRRERLTPIRIFKDLRGRSYEGCYDAVRCYAWGWQRDGTTATVKVAHVRLHSRMLSVRAYPRETQEMVFDAHDRAFAFFKGGCTRGIYDNMKTAVEPIFVGRERAYNRLFLQVCSIISLNRSHVRLRRAGTRGRSRTRSDWFGNGSLPCDCA
jgi:hypothetical protein